MDLLEEDLCGAVKSRDEGKREGNGGRNNNDTDYEG
jgi:hypothetical protein